MEIRVKFVGVYEIVKFEFFFFINLLINHTSFLAIVSNMSFVPLEVANPAARRVCHALTHMFSNNPNIVVGPVEPCSSNFRVEFVGAQFQLSVTYDCETIPIGPDNNMIYDRSLGYDDDCKYCETIEGVYKEIVYISKCLTQAAQAAQAAQAEKPLSCKQPNCQNHIRVRSELCANGDCRPCSRKLNPHFSCWNCRGKFQGKPAGQWTRGRMLCVTCEYDTPPPSSDDEFDDY